MINNKPGTLFKTSQPLWIYVRGSDSQRFSVGTILMYLKTKEHKDIGGDAIFEHYFLLPNGKDGIIGTTKNLKDWTERYCFLEEKALEEKNLNLLRVFFKKFSDFFAALNLGK